MLHLAFCIMTRKGRSFCLKLRGGDLPLFSVTGEQRTPLIGVAASLETTPVSLDFKE